jgi:hypothetical protein
MTDKKLLRNKPIPGPRRHEVKRGCKKYARMSFTIWFFTYYFRVIKNKEE